MSVANAAVGPSTAIASVRQLAIDLARRGHQRESLELCRAELRTEDGEKWLSARIIEAMTAADLTLAGNLAAILAALQRGSEWYPPRDPGEWPPTLPRIPDAQLSTSKLLHDLAQLMHLREAGVLGEAFDDVIRGYETTLGRLAGLDVNMRAALEPADEERIGRAFGRIVHLASAPRVAKALSPSWDRTEAERLYREHHPSIVVIDDFLTPDALESVYRFCLESTVWFGNRYANGRLGAFFFSGFNCPLLLQIAEEIRQDLPSLIGDTHPLRQLWGFKNTGHLPADSTIHADFAAVNVNFWISPTEGNLDPASGGMLVYDVDAPAGWDFNTYNERIDLIRDFLDARNARAIRIPYRRNRAIIFNSDLFHATEAVSFRPDYRSHRVNITMLYGDRQFDQHHPPQSSADPASPGPFNAWRSRAFTRFRR